MGVGGGVCRVVMRAEVGFHFDDAASYDPTFGAVDEELAEQAWGDKLRRGLEKSARQLLSEDGVD